MESPCIKFRYLRNAAIHLGDGVIYQIPYRMGPKLVNGVPDPSCQTGVPHFDLEKIHEVEIHDEVPQLPEREDYMDDEMYREVCKDAFEDARNARKRNASVRKALLSYEASGAIEIIDDPFTKKPKAKEVAAKAVETFGNSLKGKPSTKPEKAASKPEKPGEGDSATHEDSDSE